MVLICQSVDKAVGDWSRGEQVHPTSESTQIVEHLLVFLPNYMFPEPDSILENLTIRLDDLQSASLCTSAYRARRAYQAACANRSIEYPHALTPYLWGVMALLHQEHDSVNVSRILSFLKDASDRAFQSYC